MKKTKLTLMISSLIMVLALVVTIVSVSAAWFSNTTSTKLDKELIIGTSEIEEYVTIEVDSNMGKGGTAIWPAIAKKGQLLKNDTKPITGVDLLTDTTIVDEAPKIAKQYIPLMFVGKPDDGKTHKTLSLKLDNVSFGKYIEHDEAGEIVKDEAGKPVVIKDFKGDFNVEFAIVAVTTNDAGELLTEEVIESETDPNNLSATGIYYNQANVDGSQGDVILNMQIVPGTKYYVRAMIYYNKIDEECNHELLMEEQTIYFNFTLILGGSSAS